MTQSEEPQNGLTARADVHKRHADSKGIASRFKKSKPESTEEKAGVDVAEGTGDSPQDEAPDRSEAASEPEVKAPKKFTKRKPLTKPAAQEEPAALIEADDDAAEQANDAPSAHRKTTAQQPKARLWLRVLVVVVSCLVVAAVAIAIAFSWDRWWRYDDATDIQGQWYAVGSTVPFTITADTMVFDQKTAYSYHIDTTAKTIVYSLADMKGQGRYWFMNDRKNLVIVDGDSFTAVGTAFDDFGRVASETVMGLFGVQPALPEGDGVVVLRRDPDPDALAAQAAEAERKAKEEAEAQKKAEEEAARIAAAEEEGAPQEEGAPPGGFANESMGMFE